MDTKILKGLFGAIPVVHGVSKFKYDRWVEEGMPLVAPELQKNVSRDTFIRGGYLDLSGHTVRDIVDNVKSWLLSSVAQHNVTEFTYINVDPEDWEITLTYLDEPNAYEKEVYEQDLALYKELSKIKPLVIELYKAHKAVADKEYNENILRQIEDLQKKLK